ncbi:cupin domain-containing protein [Bradyrhizobium liaoningense]|uniref:cupin domain-containing protein n=1 Tax=Bradyrhizobium liaoningense TaxID=43992 RepID=UPI001BA98E53|nr:cupin domain-containing protein [Bradyrhizobium liaoningense]MBR1066493.1 cupin domain-containing protein [Bradyrhizobium liaoningense]
MSEFHFSRSVSAPKNERFFRISSANFPALKGVAIQDLDMAPGESRSAHLHPNAAQLDYCISGNGEVGIVGPDGDHHVIPLQSGDAAFVPQGYVHWIENNSKAQARFILIATHERPETIEVQAVNAAVPANQK